jgi:hypothetical protein
VTRIVLVVIEAGFTMDANGAHNTPVTQTKNWEGMPDWGTG